MAQELKTIIAEMDALYSKLDKVQIKDAPLLDLYEDDPTVGYDEQQSASLADVGTLLQKAIEEASFTEDQKQQIQLVSQLMKDKDKEYAEQLERARTERKVIDKEIEVKRDQLEKAIKSETSDIAKIQTIRLKHFTKEEQSIFVQFLIEKGISFHDRKGRISFMMMDMEEGIVLKQFITKELQKMDDEHIKVAEKFSKFSQSSDLFVYSRDDIELFYETHCQ